MGTSIPADMTPFSRHALGRMAQRALPTAALDLVLSYGASIRVHGADSYFFDKAARRRAREQLGDTAARCAERYMNTYAVVADDGTVITAAWRTRRLRRP